MHVPPLAALTADLGGIGRPLLEQEVALADVNTAPTGWRMGHDMMVTLQATSSSCPGGRREGGVVALRISSGEHPSINLAD
jgi:hypothetical protein